MRRVVIAAVVILLGGVLVPSGQTALAAKSWTTTGPTSGGYPNGGDRATGIAMAPPVVDPANPQVAYMFNRGGPVWKTVNGGANWFPSGRGLQDGIVQLIGDPKHPQVLYASTVNGIYKTTNGARNWSKASFGLSLPLNPANLSLAISPLQTQTLMVVGSCNPSCPQGQIGLYRTTNGGRVWTLLRNPKQVEGPLVIAGVLGPGQPSGVIYAGCYSGGFCRSTNGGQSWTAGRWPSQVIQSIGVDPRRPSTVYAASYCGGLFKSTNAGSNWSRTYAPPGLTSTIAVDPQNSSRVYVAGTLGNSFSCSSSTPTSPLFVTGDGGRHWHSAFGPLQRIPEPPATSIAIAPSRPGTLYAAVCCSLGGFWKSTDKAASWHVVNAGLPADYSVSAFAMAPSNPKVLYALGNPVQKSTDGGRSWLPNYQGLWIGNCYYGCAIAVDPRNPNVVYASSQSGGMYKTVNGGSTWFRLPCGCGEGVIAFDPRHSSTVYAGGGEGVWKTTNGGASWRQLSWLKASDDHQVKGFAHVKGLAVDPLDTNTIYVGGWSDDVAGDPILPNPGLWKSADGGESWRPISGTGIQTPQTITFDSHGTVYIASVDEGITKSTDGGQSWTPAGLCGYDVRRLATDPKNAQVVYAAVASGSGAIGANCQTLQQAGGWVYKTTDGGRHWSPFGGGALGGATAVQIDPGASRLYASTNGPGVWTYPLP